MRSIRSISCIEGLPIDLALSRNGAGLIVDDLPAAFLHDADETVFSRSQHGFSRHIHHAHLEQPGLDSDTLVGNVARRERIVEANVGIGEGDLAGGKLPEYAGPVVADRLSTLTPDRADRSCKRGIRRKQLAERGRITLLIGFGELPRASSSSVCATAADCRGRTALSDTAGRLCDIPAQPAAVTPTIPTAETLYASAST